VSDLTENIDFERELSEIHSKLFPRFGHIIKRYLEEPGMDKLAPPPTGLAEAVTAMGMYASSKKIERYSKLLAVLTVVLILLTGVLIYRTFLPLAEP